MEVSVEINADSVEMVRRIAPETMIMNEEIDVGSDLCILLRETGMIVCLHVKYLYK